MFLSVDIYFISLVRGAYGVHHTSDAESSVLNYRRNNCANVSFMIVTFITDLGVIRVDSRNMRVRLPRRLLAGVSPIAGVAIKSCSYTQHRAICFSLRRRKFHAIGMICLCDSVYSVV